MVGEVRFGCKAGDLQRAGCTDCIRFVICSSNRLCMSLLYRIVQEMLYMSREVNILQSEDRLCNAKNSQKCKQKSDNTKTEQPLMPWPRLEVHFYPH